jgi:hypothetical protein
MNEQELHEYTQWLMEVWNPNQLYIPFVVDAPKAYLRYKTEQLNLPHVIGQSEQFICPDCKRPEKYYSEMCHNDGPVKSEVHTTHPLIK